MQYSLFFSSPAEKSNLKFFGPYRRRFWEFDDGTLFGWKVKIALPRGFLPLIGGKKNENSARNPYKKIRVVGANR
ncbi:hypothetical protein B9Z55_016923 [Caenorhabditis nigoni]|uniref:Uncharacterized protein n=1 Tax=Caenorhabditis nigoni TaxID=1611254 RepID=A0A2G5T788_9PELO|nr:hypothetical protein B9Z55_016923 [Caenorhabditis nigoni]